ncbi:MAG: hypothetical protein FWE03_00215 [Firmicutes bacterium]|nr:hypothetical protein [Bacillota bacterium]
MDACINELSPDHREVIEAVFFRKLKVRELAQALDISFSWADKRIIRAVSALEKLYIIKKL